MKKWMLGLLVCAAAALLCSCREESSTDSVETTAPIETTTTTITTTTTSETTTTTTTTADFILAPDVLLAVQPASVRGGCCTLTLTNNGEAAVSFEPSYRIYDVSTGALLTPNSEELPEGKAESVAAGKSKDIKVDWEARYGILPDGTYLFEQQLTAPEEQEQLLVCQAQFIIDTYDFVPHLTIDEGTLKSSGCTVTVHNSLDAPRDYALVYRLYDVERDMLLLKKVDTSAKVTKNHHMEAGESLQIPMSWDEEFGNLAIGKYAIEINLLAAGASESEVYRVEFDITT